MKADYAQCVGSRFGRWQVLGIGDPREYRYATGSQKTYTLRARCECGTVKGVVAHSMVNGKTMACSDCSKRYQNGSASPHWTGEGIVPGAYIGSVKNNARTRQIVYDLPDGYLQALWDKQRGKCALTGVELWFAWPRKKAQTKPRDKRQTAASLDRVDPTKGYVAGNVQWTCSAVNLMKLDLHPDEFQQWVSLIWKWKQNT